MKQLWTIAVYAALLLSGCKRQSDPPAPAPRTDSSFTNVAQFTSAARYLIDTSGTNTAPSLRHDLSLTPAARHHLASLGFSYGVQAERGRWTGDTNSLAFTEERLRAVVDGLGRDDAAPWGPRPPVVGREDASDVERVSEEP